MELQYLYSASAEKLEKTKAFLAAAGLEYDEGCSFTVNALDDGEIIATGSLDGNVLKCIAVSPLRQGEGLSATIVTELRKAAFDKGESHLFIFTKPNNIDMFEGLSFYPVAKTRDALLMESTRGGCEAFVSALPKREGICGAIVANCNPFTLGHRYLVEQAAKECDWLYLFILSEDKSRFSAHTRLELAKKGVADLSNVIVCPTGKYLISSATFPTYFIKDKTFAEDIKCDMDIEVFTSRFAKALNITKRFVGTEPNSPVTNAYNERLKLLLPQHGIKLIEIERKTSNSEPISASRVRKLITQGNRSELIPLLPRSTMDYIDKEFFEK
ncbi:MAG: [Clostridia bacterium]|nr:[citrate (pro-3S)-lyase] ligase [Clostridia bacterium]